MKASGRSTPIRWRWGLLAALGIILLSMLPQFHLWYQRGSNWNGANANFYTDEPAYAAYVTALVDGRPRRNDPYTGIDDQPASPLAESLFSIQFIPAYLIAWPARLLGISTATAFILLSPLCAALIALGLFWLLSLFIEDGRMAAAGVWIILCLGLLVSGHGIVRNFFHLNAIFVYLPFLRRYNPVVPFFFFILFFPLIWLGLTGAKRRSRLLYTGGAFLCFVICLYGYFYLWTALAAISGLFIIFWWTLRPQRWREALESLTVFWVLSIIAAVPYVYLLSQRARTMDTGQALTSSHAFDLFHWIEVFAGVLIAVLVVAFRRKRIDAHDPRLAFAISLSASIFVLFNHQVITGRSLQPMHYEQFVTSYLALIATAVVATVFAEQLEFPKQLFRRAILVIALLSLMWGAGETWVSIRRFAIANVSRDEARPLALRLRQMAINGRDDRAGNLIDHHTVVFDTDYSRADGLPAVAPLAILWSPHMFVFSSLTVSQNKERFFQYLYYSGIDPENFVRNYQRLGFAQFAIFGWERSNPNLTLNYRPITDEELRIEANHYRDYFERFDFVKATQPTLSYLIVNADQQFESSNLDRWYIRDNGERINSIMLYRLKLRP